MTQNIAASDYGSNIAGTIHPEPFAAALAAWKQQRDRLNSLPSGTSNEVETHELDLLTEAESRLLATPFPTSRTFAPLPRLSGRTQTASRLVTCSPVSLQPCASWTVRSAA